MAMIKCPECGQEISDKALKCPKCGYPIQEYLRDKTKMGHMGDAIEASSQEIVSTNNQETTIKTKSKKKLFILVLIICIVLLVMLGVILGKQYFTSMITVKNISISKWRLTDSTNYGDYYEGTLTSEQKKPFVAVIGEYEDKEAVPRFIYMEDGMGVIETYEDTDEDPSIKYRGIGYLNGTPIDSSDVKVNYTDSDYYDWSYSDYTSCDVLIDFDMNSKKSGLLIFDVVNETNNEVERNLSAAIIDGKAEYSYYANLPYKARGIEVSIEPKLFCKCDAITKEDYVIEKAYTAEKYEGSYSNSYSGEETLAFSDYADGFVLYKSELKEGGNKENRNRVRNFSVFLHNEECILETYDSVDEDENILMPKYNFDIVGYITWKPLEKENN